MKKVKICVLLICAMLLTGCGRTDNSKVLGFIELNKTTIDECSELNLELKSEQYWDDEKQCWGWVNWWEADYTFQDVPGTLVVNYNHAEERFVRSVVFTVEATEENKVYLEGYMIDTYGKQYKEIGEKNAGGVYSKYWESGDMAIEYLTTSRDVELGWYIPSSET